MHNINMIIGSFGVTRGAALRGFEDECVGNSPEAIEGIVVTRLEDQKVFVCDWHINAHFEGSGALEQFEEAKNSQNFDYTFSGERELQKDESLDGTDPVLMNQLRKHYLVGQPQGSNMDRLKQVISKRFKH